ncbi:MAG TPA: NUDIX hydrolase [Candidatus Saccharibacteria bacterium]|nr:NUDIX hydrolase [Candidatus Saccharibacteria bacterium]HRK93820.1 NUDIX hydrolase [Candidatus Saccharibacteria bacterium]
MIEQTTLQHHIQKHIISVLMYQKFARFRDLRPPKVDTNLYSYHLKLLQKAKLVEKTEDGYTLTKKGILYIDRVTTSTLDVRSQPKIITMLLVQNSEGDILLFRRRRQPYTNTWTLPYGKLHIDDRSLLEAAHREADEKLGLKNQTITHAGDCYIRIRDGEETLMTTLAHVFRFYNDDVELNDYLQWVQPHKLHSIKLAPAVEKIVARAFFNDPYFFEEFEEKWGSEGEEVNLLQ